MFTDACSMSNKQDDLEVQVFSQSYGVIGISETWCDESNNWIAGMEGYGLFRNDMQGRWGGVLVL